jgi:ABC-type protease/lipase transport system fused ATPase/permease subunit
MRWMKALAIAAAVLVVFIAISFVLHFLYWIAVGVVIAAAIVAAFKVHEKYKLARQHHEQARLQREQRRTDRRQDREERHTPRSVEAAPPQAPQIPPTAPAHGDIEEELARLKRDMR